MAIIAAHLYAPVQNSFAAHAFIFIMIQSQSALNVNTSVPSALQIHKRQHLGKCQHSYLCSSREFIFTLATWSLFLELNVRLSHTGMRRSLLVHH